jgi:hypothetical protein
MRSAGPIGAVCRDSLAGQDDGPAAHPRHHQAPSRYAAESQRADGFAVTYAAMTFGNCSTKILRLQRKLSHRKRRTVNDAQRAKLAHEIDAAPQEAVWPTVLTSSAEVERALRACQSIRP